jgi:hypothetical protein
MVAIGILFEQASSRGHAQETANGILKFPFYHKNQFHTALSTLEGAKHYERIFRIPERFLQTGSCRQLIPVKAYVFGDKNDKAKHFILLKC